MDDSLVVNGLDIKQLSDDDLNLRLQNFGFPICPIVDSTRSVYQKKLANLLRGGSPPVSDEEAEEDEDDLAADKSEDERNVVNQSALGMNSPATFRYEELKRRPLARPEGESWRMRSSDIVTQVEPSPTDEAEGSAGTLLIKVVLFSVILLIGLLIYQNMEANVHNPVPHPD